MNDFDEMRRLLECEICGEFFKAAVSLRCEHDFCRACVEEHFTKVTAMKCPVCSSPCSSHGVRYNSHLDSLVEVFRSMVSADSAETAGQATDESGDISRASEAAHKAHTELPPPPATSPVLFSSTPASLVGSPALTSGCSDKECDKAYDATEEDWRCEGGGAVAEPPPESDSGRGPQRPVPVTVSPIQSQINCPVCTFLNDESDHKCSMCFSALPSPMPRRSRSAAAAAVAARATKCAGEAAVLDSMEERRGSASVTNATMVQKARKRARTSTGCIINTATRFFFCESFRRWKLTRRQIILIFQGQFMTLWVERTLPFLVTSSSPLIPRCQGQAQAPSRLSYPERSPQPVTLLAAGSSSFVGSRSQQKKSIATVCPAYNRKAPSCTFKAHPPREMAPLAAEVWQCSCAGNVVHGLFS